MLKLLPSATGPNNTAFTALATATLASRVLGPANVPYMVKLPRFMTTVLACPATLMVMLPDATGMLILVAPLLIPLLEPALSPVKNAPLLMKKFPVTLPVAETSPTVNMLPPVMLAAEVMVDVADIRPAVRILPP